MAGMSPLESVVRFLVAIGVVIAAISNYLIINKLWKRKHLKDVAESVSISAALLGLFTAIPLLIQGAVYDETPMPALKTGIGIVTGVIFVMIGSGMWVKGNRETPFRQLLLRSLRLEKKESADLLKAMSRPKGAGKIIEILELMAKLDRHVHESEIALLKRFAEDWKIEPPDLRVGRVLEDSTLLEVRTAVQDYLALSPPHEQAAHLLDVLNLFVKADDDVSHEERVVIEEVNGLIQMYVGGDTIDRQTYEVVIVPQSAEQFEAVEAIIPGASVSERRGGKVISVGTFFSHDYAEAVCQKYIALGLFTAQVAG
ncbi:MAG: TerB family tellurite resistance protein [Gemmatimonadota bacterium]|nr:TerB family tellurite resistance protein [Gemmatimonadota bacterium]